MRTLSARGHRREAVGGGQERAVCWSNDLAWLQPFLVDVDYVRYFQSFLMRMRGTLRVPPHTAPMHYPSCYPEPHWT